MRAFRTGSGSRNAVAATVGANLNSTLGIRGIGTQSLQVPRDAERYFGVSLTAKF